jgi:hypothetical protein
MIRFILFLSIIAVGCGVSQVGSMQQDLKQRKLEVSGSHLALAEPIYYKNMAVVPVLNLKEDKFVQDYITLSEAKKNGWVEIVEIPGRETVERLEVRNKGPKDLLLIAGELLIGGKQDRVVAKDTVVEAGQSAMVPVFCVEQGRWSSSWNHFEGGETMVPNEVRKAAAFADQFMVWQEVEGFNIESKAQGDGTTVFKGLSSKEVQTAIQEALPGLVQAINKNKNVVGILFLLNGEVQCFERFGNSTLFRSCLERLLRSYIAQASVAPSKKHQVSLKHCAEFVKTSLMGKREVVSSDPNRFRLQSEAGGLQGYETCETDHAGKPTETLLHGTYMKE